MRYRGGGFVAAIYCDTFVVRQRDLGHVVSPELTCNSAIHHGDNVLGQVG